MASSFLDIAATPHVRDVQEEMGSGQMWSEPGIEPPSDRFGEHERWMITTRDSFYMATVSETGWPYLQHRGGPQGFLRLMDDKTLLMADFSGNRQYISTGNLRTSDRACLFLMDYPRRARLKIYATVTVLAPEAHPALLAQAVGPERRGQIERLMLFRLEAFSWNCPQHITPRYTAAQIAEQYANPLHARIAALEQENRALRALIDQRREPDE